ncbi:MAG: hypothetical protein FJ220_03330 [Kiritimatiellaceae bacterium]|nr:hypothetical protein [Kiritimatiellaceae bacterium]
MSTLREESWQIKRRSDVCSGSNTPFADKEEIVTRLLLQDGAYVREDYRLSYWNEHQLDHGQGSWKSIFRVPPPPTEVVKKENAETLLRNRVAKEDPDDIHAIYILAVMLERKKILIEKEVKIREDRTKLRVYEHKKTGEIFLVVDPELKLAEIEKVQESVIGMLGGKPPKTETVYFFEALLHALIEKHEKLLFPKRTNGEDRTAQKLAAAFFSLLAGKKCPYWEESNKLFNRYEDSEAWRPVIAHYRLLIDQIPQEIRFQGLEKPAFTKRLEALSLIEPKDLKEDQLLEFFSIPHPRAAELRESFLEAVRQVTKPASGII